MTSARSKIWEQQLMIAGPGDSAQIPPLPLWDAKYDTR